MPHISKKKLGKKIEDTLERHMLSLVRDSASNSRVRIFEELLTKTERIMLAKRIGALFLLKKGLSLYRVSDILQISPSTAARFQRDLESNKYRHAAEWLWRKTEKGKFETFLESLVRLAFTGRAKSFKKFVEEI